MTVEPQTLRSSWDAATKLEATKQQLQEAEKDIRQPRLRKGERVRE